MRACFLALTQAAALLTTPAATAQYYERHWNTAVVPAPLRSSPIVTHALPPQSSPNAPASSAGQPRPSHTMTGIASYYWQGQKTASGEMFDKNALTAAHRTLPMHTRVKVTHVETGKSVVVRINDRGPFKPGRVVDLSDRAAEILGFKAKGLARVKLEVVQ